MVVIVSDACCCCCVYMFINFKHELSLIETFSLFCFIHVVHDSVLYVHVKRCVAVVHDKTVHVSLVVRHCLYMSLFVHICMY